MRVLNWTARVMIALLMTLAIILVWWGAELVHEVTLRVFSKDSPDVTMGTATAYATFFALVGLIVVGMWKAAVELLKWRVGENKHD